VIAILDGRLRTKSYGRDFLNSLPKARVTDDLNEVARIFAVAGV
jgi:Rad3-related DNA helicase